MRRWIPRLGSNPIAARLRVLIVAVTLAIALGSLVHVTHSHEAQGTGAASHCLYCSSFDRGAAPPPASMATLFARGTTAPPTDRAQPTLDRSGLASYAARAPPETQA